MPAFPDSANNLQEIEKIVSLRMEFYNTKHLNKSIYKQTPEALEQALEAHEDMAPAIIAHSYSLKYIFRIRLLLISMDFEEMLYFKDRIDIQYKYSWIMKSKFQLSIAGLSKSRIKF